MIGDLEIEVSNEQLKHFPQCT